MISIIIPAYNAASTIERCLASIFAQTLTPDQIVVVDDASIDRTWQILTAIKNHESRIRNYGSDFDSLFIIRNSVNQGAQAVRNRGWQEIQKHPPPQSSPTRWEDEKGKSFTTRGEETQKSSPPLVGGVRGGEQYILFCDADIVLRRDCLEKMARALEKHPDASYAYSSFKFGWKKFKLWPFDAEKLKQMPYIHTTSLIRAEHFPGFDESIKRLQDWDLWLTMLEQGHTGVWVPDVLFRVISTEGTMSFWLPAFAYKLSKWLGIQPKAVARYNEAVARIKAKHQL